MTSISFADIRIRTTLHPGDLGYIAYIHGSLYAKECGYGLSFEGYVLDGLKDFAKEYDQEKDRIWICEHNDKIVGCLIAHRRNEALQFRYFIFLPEYRGLGLGKHLMQQFIAFMKEKEIKHAFLWTTEEQLTAVSLYTKYGFQLTEEKKSNSFDKPLREFRYDLLFN